MIMMNDEHAIETMVAEALALCESGVPEEEIVRRYPAHAQELRDVFSVASEFAAMSARIDVPRNGLMRLLNALPDKQHASAHARSETQAHVHIHRAWWWAAVPTLAMLMLVVGIGVRKVSVPAHPSPALPAATTQAARQADTSDDAIDQDLQTIDEQLDGLSSDEMSADQVPDDYQ